MSQGSNAGRARRNKKIEAQQQVERLRIEDPKGYGRVMDRIRKVAESSRVPRFLHSYLHGNQEAVLVKLICSFGKEAAPWATWQICKAACRVGIEVSRGDKNWHRHHVPLEVDLHTLDALRVEDRACQRLETKEAIQFLFEQILPLYSSELRAAAVEVIWEAGLEVPQKPVEHLPLAPQVRPRARQLRRQKLRDQACRLIAEHLRRFIDN